MKENISLEKDRIKLLSLKFRLQMVTGIHHLQTPISSPASPKKHFQKEQTIQLVIKLTCAETLQEEHTRVWAKKSKRVNMWLMCDCVR